MKKFKFNPLLVGKKTKEWVKTATDDMKQDVYLKAYGYVQNRYEKKHGAFFDAVDKECTAVYFGKEPNLEIWKKISKVLKLSKFQNAKAKAYGVELKKGVDELIEKFEKKQELTKQDLVFVKLYLQEFFSEARLGTMKEAIDCVLWRS